MAKCKALTGSAVKGLNKSILTSTPILTVCHTEQNSILLKTSRPISSITLSAVLGILRWRTPSTTNCRWGTAFRCFLWQFNHCRRYSNRRVC